MSLCRGAIDLIVAQVATPLTGTVVDLPRWKGNQVPLITAWLVQFRALSDQLYHSSSHHGELRQQVVKQLRSTPEVYKGFVGESYTKACPETDANARSSLYCSS